MKIYDNSQNSMKRRKRLPRSVRKFIRREKARANWRFLNSEERKIKAEEIYSKFSSPGTKKSEPKAISKIKSQNSKMKIKSQKSFEN